MATQTRRTGDGTVTKRKIRTHAETLKARPNALEKAGHELPPTQGLTPELRSRAAARYIAQGKSRYEILELLQNQYQCSYEYAKELYKKAVDWLTPAEESEFGQEIRTKSITALETIIEDTMAQKQYKQAISAIELLGKIAGITNPNNKLEVMTNKDGETAFRITFD